MFYTYFRKTPMAATALMTLGMLLAFAAWSSSRFGSVSRGLAYVRGERLFVDETSKSLENLRPGEERRVTFRVTNLSGRSLQLIGARTSCGCTGVQGLPMSIPRLGTRPLVVRVKPAASSDLSKVSLELLTDNVEQPTVFLTITAKVH